MFHTPYNAQSKQLIVVLTLSVSQYDYFDVIF